jgi:hypothetical protein
MQAISSWDIYIPLSKFMSTSFCNSPSFCLLHSKITVFNTYSEEWIRPGRKTYPGFCEELESVAALPEILC